jgi:ketosteroid isomerase-like protein
LSETGDDRIVSQENVEIVRRAVEEFNRSGFGAIGTSELMSDDVEFHEPPEQPAPRVARGRREARELATEFDAAWVEHRSEPREIRALDADRVLLLTLEHFKGRDGIEVEAPFASVFTIRGGKICLWRAFWDEAKALEAAGLS